MVRKGTPISTLPGETLIINDKEYNSLHVGISNQQTTAKVCNVELLLGSVENMLSIPAAELKTDTLEHGEGVTKTFKIKSLKSFPHKEQKLIQIESDCGASATATTEIYLEKEK